MKSADLCLCLETSGNLPQSCFSYSPHLKMYECICILMYMTKRIGHLDADCFYVSCERVRHRLSARAGGGGAQQPGGLRDRQKLRNEGPGVTTGMPIWDALPLCPEAIFIKRDFEWYEVLSRRILDVANRFSPAVEYYSIDEMFFDADAIRFPRGQSRCNRPFSTRPACR